VGIGRSNGSAIRRLNGAGNFEALGLNPEIGCSPRPKVPNYGGPQKSELRVRLRVQLRAQKPGCRERNFWMQRQERQNRH